MNFLRYELIQKLKKVVFKIFIRFLYLLLEENEFKAIYCIFVMNEVKVNNVGIYLYKKCISLLRFILIKNTLTSWEQ